MYSRKKIEEEKPTSIISPQQARTGSTSTDVTYASQYVCPINFKIFYLYNLHYSTIYKNLNCVIDYH